jgi:hypothetical protein
MTTRFISQNYATRVHGHLIQIKSARRQVLGVGLASADGRLQVTKRARRSAAYAAAGAVHQWRRVSPYCRLTIRLSHLAATLVPVTTLSMITAVAITDYLVAGGE